VYAAAWDNEYIWKGNLLRADGWLSRLVTDVAVPAEDPMVLYAIGQPGELYQSRDGAATAAGWQPVDTSLPSPARAIDAGPKVRMVFAACEDGFYASVTGGASWESLPVPGNGTPVDVVVDTANPHVLYAVTDAGVYRSLDFGEKFLGKKWETLTDGLPPAASASFTLAPPTADAPGRIYAVLDGSLFTRALDEHVWSRGTSIGFAEETRNYPWIAVDPSNPDRAVAGIWTEYGGMGARSLLQQTNDGGRTWSPSIQDIYALVAESGLMGVLAKTIEGKIGTPVIDPRDPAVMFAPGDRRGALKSADGGNTFEGKKSGLTIPVVHTVIAPRNTDWVFAGTPGGLFVSKDGGETWVDGNLWLQFTKNTRRELGGAAFIDAYWRGRYYGFIDDAAATTPYSGE
jgi:photosystem II stability/assembly factor-like uncharacterized protein